MAASIVGSRSLDERRRRRLASEADDAGAATGGSGKKARRKKGKTDAELRGTRLPLRKIISKRRWKIYALGLLLLLPVAGVLIGALRLEYVSRVAGPAVARLLDPSEDRLGRAWGSFMLLISSELCVLIWWVRSHSPSDFGGRFGVWLWGAAACFLFSACVATDAHLFFSSTVLYFRLVHFPQLGAENTEILCWLAPAAVFGIGLIRSLHLDMRRCWSSVLILWLAVFAWLGSAFVQSQTQWTTDLPRRELLSLGGALVGHVLLVLSFLLHARFVLYETSAPPPEVATTSEPKRPLLRLASLFRRTPAQAEEAEEETSSRKGRGGAKRSTKPAKKAAPKRAASKSDSSKDDESDEDWSKLEEATKPAAPTAAPKPSPAPSNVKPGGTPSGSQSSSGGAGRNERPNAPSHPFSNAPPKSTVSMQRMHDEDDSDDEDGDDEGNGRDSTKGLSKRERRKLQKQMRQQQRAA